VRPFPREVSAASASGRSAGSGTGRRDRFVRQAGLTSLAAAASVASGLVLDVTVAASFGAGRATDAFFVAARIPFALVTMLLVSANQALVPTFSVSLVKRGERETWRLATRLIIAVLVGGGLLVALIGVAAEPLMRVTAPGLSADQVTLAASLARITFAIVPLVGVAEVLRAVLNARRATVAPAAMDVVMNGLAACLIIATAHGDIHRVAVAFVAGAAAQLAYLLAVAYAHGFRLQPTLSLRDPELLATARLCVRPMVGAGLNPVARVGEQLMVSFLPSGSISVLNYGYRLISAVGGTVFFRSVMVTVLPRLSEATARDDEAEVKRLAGLGVRLMLTVSIPLTAFLAVLAKPAVLVVFQRGSLTRDGASLLGLVLAIYSASLIGSAIQRALLAPFFARLDTRTPLRNTTYGIVANLLFLPAFVLPFGLHSANAVLGVALAYSLAQYVNVAHAWFRVRGVVGDPLAGVSGWLTRLLCASLVSGGVMAGAYAVFRLDTPWPRTELLARTAGVGAGGLVVLGAAALLLSRAEVVWFRGRLRPDRRRLEGA